MLPAAGTLWKTFAQRLPAVARLLLYVATFLLLCGCQSVKSRILGASANPIVPPPEIPAQQPSPLAANDPASEQRDSPELAFNTCTTPSTHCYGQLISDESQDLFTVEALSDQVPQSGPPNYTFARALWQHEHTLWTVSAITSGMVSPSVIGPLQPSPGQWAVGSSSTFLHLLENGGTEGVDASVDLVCQSPYASFDQSREGIKVFFRVPQGPYDFWLFSLNYSSSNSWSLPVPKVEHTWQPSNWLRADAGVTLPTTSPFGSKLSLNLSVNLLLPMEP